MRRLSQISDSSFVRILLLILLLIIIDSRTCYGQSELPEFTGERLTFSGVDSAAWQSLPPVIAELEQSGHETFYVVVVESSGSGPTATVDYTNRLYEHWRQQAARNSVVFDTQRTVIVVLAIQNRQISVKAGQTLLVERDAIARVYDAKGSQVKSVTLTTKLPFVQAGKNAVMFDCEFQGDSPPKVAVSFKTMGQPSRVR